MITKSIDKSSWDYFLQLFNQDFQLLAIDFDMNSVQSLSILSDLCVLFKTLFLSYLELFGQSTMLNMDEKIMEIMGKHLLGIESICTVYTLNFLLENKHLDRTSILTKLKLDGSLQKIKFLLKERLTSISSFSNQSFTNQIIENANNPENLQIFLNLKKVTGPIILMVSSTHPLNIITNPDLMPLLKRACLQETYTIEEKNQIIKILQTMQGLSMQLLAFGQYKNILADSQIQSNLQIILNSLNSCIRQ